MIESFSITVKKHFFFFNKIISVSDLFQSLKNVELFKKLGLIKKKGNKKKQS